MVQSVVVFLAALVGLLVSARFFTSAAEGIGRWLKLSPFVIGVFIVGIEPTRALASYRKRVTNEGALKVEFGMNAMATQGDLVSTGDSVSIPVQAVP